METEIRKPLQQIVLHIRRFADHNGTKVLKNNGGYTVLIRKNDELHGHYDLSLARCGKKDNFSKKIGSAIVKGRLACSRHLTYVPKRPKLSVVSAVYTLVQKCHAEHTLDKDFISHLVDKL